MAQSNQNTLWLLLGSKTLGTKCIRTKCIRTSFYICWQTMIKTFSLGLDLVKVCFNVSLESSNCRKITAQFCKARSIEE